MVAAVRIVGSSVEARLVVGNADPGGDMFGLDTERLQVACQLAAPVDARVRDREKRTSQPRDAIHLYGRLTVLRTRTLFYVVTGLPPRAPLAKCVTPVF